MLNRRDLFARASALTTALMGGAFLRSKSDSSPIPLIDNLKGSDLVNRMRAEDLEAGLTYRISSDDFVGTDSSSLIQIAGKLNG